MINSENIVRSPQLINQEHPSEDKVSVHNEALCEEKKTLTVMMRGSLLDQMKLELLTQEFLTP